MNGRTSTLIRWGAGGALALALAAGTAASQQDAGKPHDKQAEKDAQQKQQLKSQQMQDGMQDGMQEERRFIPAFRDANAIFQREMADGHTITVLIVRGRIVAAEYDNQPISTDRVLVEGNKISILEDKPRNAIAEIDLPNRDTVRRLVQSAQMSHDRLPERFAERRLGTGEPSYPDTGWRDERFYSTPSRDSYSSGNHWESSRTARPMGTTEYGTTTAGQRPVLGVVLIEADPNDLRRMNAPSQYSRAVIIERVHDDLPADRAGLQERDIIIAVDGQRPATSAALRSAVERKNYGESVRVTVLRDGRERDYDVFLFRPGQPGADQWGETGTGRMYYAPEPYAPYGPEKIPSDQWRPSPQHVPPGPDADFNPRNPQP